MFFQLLYAGVILNEFVKARSVFKEKIFCFDRTTTQYNNKRAVFWAQTEGEIKPHDC